MSFRVGGWAAAASSSPMGWVHAKHTKIDSARALWGVLKRGIMTPWRSVGTEIPSVWHTTVLPQCKGFQDRFCGIPKTLSTDLYLEYPPAMLETLLLWVLEFRIRSVAVKLWHLRFQDLSTLRRDKRVWDLVAAWRWVLRCILSMIGPLLCFILIEEDPFVAFPQPRLLVLWTSRVHSFDALYWLVASIGITRCKVLWTLKFNAHQLVQTG